MENIYKRFDIGISAIIILLFIGFSYADISILNKLDGPLFNFGAKIYLASDQPYNEIILVDIDDKSLNKLGPWPWPRKLLGDMINLLEMNNVKVVALNIPLTNKENNNGLKELQSFRKKLSSHSQAEKDTSFKKWIQENLDQLENSMDNDKALVECLRNSGKVILPVFGRQNAPVENGEKQNAIPLGLERDFLAPDKISTRVIKKLSIHQIYPPETDFLSNAMGLGYSNLTGGDEASRGFYTLFIIHGDSILPSMALRLAIAFLGEESKNVIVSDSAINMKDLSIPLYQGELPTRFNDKPGLFQRYSFADILQTKQQIPAVKGKIAIINLNIIDSYPFISPDLIDKNRAEQAAQVLGNIIEKRYIARPSYLEFVEYGLLLLFGIAFSLFYYRQDLPVSLLSTCGFILALFVLSFLLISLFGIWFKPIFINLCIFVLFLWHFIKQTYLSDIFPKESRETTKMLGLSYQSQGHLDLAFEKFRKLPLNNETMDLIYNLASEFEKKRMIDQALAAFEYIYSKGDFKDVRNRINQLKQSDKSSTIGSYGGTSEESIVGDATVGPKKNVGRYEILGELGKGSMGLVYKAQDPKINRLVAIKTIRFSDEFDEDVIHEIKERFFREAEIAGQLSHPSIVTIHDVGDDQDLTYMAMEFLEGEDLDNFIHKENLLPFIRVLDIIAQIAGALDFAHKADVIHRDIKPANVMLLKNRRVKVTDFGIAKAISSSRTKTGVILGTPNYMSPEQIMGQKIDARSDIFSLGVLFFQLITGELPFHGENLSGLLYQITQVKHSSPRDFNPKIPKICVQIIDKAMAKNPDKRFKTAGDMEKVIRLLIKKLNEMKKKTKAA